ncbi:unnamed protein product [Phytophthora fragariaefolia]|uniref:Unnamed protein product n=1 Tax=Phytophthora fragariaefolia TaxID=1490495 RepID=A0A9W7CJA7_9STRA|nr:unnamed protein product [Phytophthora fragariaefolia]
MVQSLRCNFNVGVDGASCAAVQRRGHVVWLDIEKLSAGIDWEEGIAGGLSWVRDAGQDGRVLLVMTPHALRRPDGYCLNEVARAASLRLNIFPVMVAESAPPPISPLEVDKDASKIASITGETDKILTTATGIDTGEDTSASSRRTRYVLSYDESCSVLAQQIYNDLTDAGFPIYPVSSPSSFSMETRTMSTSDYFGVNCERNSREDALQWASAEKDGKIILLLTAESVGRPHGVSLNDVSAGMSAGLGFVPLLVRPCEIPLSICRIQWLDMSDCLHHGEGNTAASLNTIRYESRKAQLISALEGTLDHEGQQARLFSLLAPFNFQRQISQLTERFIGREWLFDLFQEWIQGSSRVGSLPGAAVLELVNRRIFWVVGQIGSGKSSIAAQMVQSCPEIAAFHFAQQEDEQTHNARRCVLSLAYQLTTQLPEYAHYLQSHEPLEEMVPVASFVELISHLLIGPLSTISRPATYKSLVLLIDGIEWLIPDSSLSTSPSMPPLSGGSWREKKDEECLVSMLPALVSRLPEWVRLVVLSREDPPVLSKLHAFEPADVVIDRFQQENDHDIRHYISISLSKLPLGKVNFASTVAQSGFDPDNNQEFGMEQVIELIARRSEGNFLYAVNVVQAIREGRLRFHELAELPVGMGAYLQQFFASHFSDHDVYKRRVRPVLEVLCAAYEPLLLATLARVLEWDVYDQRDASTMLGSLFCIESGHDAESQLLRPFHSSVLDWVQDSTSSGDFYVDVASGHERLGRWAAREYQALARSNAFEFVNLNYELESSGDEKLKAKIYIVRNACNHLMLVAAFAADEKFQLARRLLHVRAEGLQSFFHGEISRDQAQKLLTRRQPPRVGSFLIRYTSRQRTYCASFIAALDEATGAPKFRHNLIHHLENGSYSTVAPAEVTEKTVLYPDLISFVEQYQRKGVLTAPVAREAPLNREISSSADENPGS